MTLQSSSDSIALPTRPDSAKRVVFAFGSNGSGQLGIGHEEDVNEPTVVKFGPGLGTRSVLKFAAGGNHSLIISEDGPGTRVAWAGASKPGCCGTSTSEVDLNPVFQELLNPKFTRNTIQAAATWEASFLVQGQDETAPTSLYAFGTGNKGELSLGKDKLKVLDPTRIPNFPPQPLQDPGESKDEFLHIVDLSASMGHVVAVLSNGDAYAWGNCRKHQGGVPNEVVHVPRKIENVGFKVARAVCGREFTCIFGAPGSGKIKVFGSDKWGIVSNAPVTAPDWKDVGAGWGAIFILKKDGGLVGWGRDDHGQLPPPNLPKLDKIAVGSEHVVALTEDGDVLAWGWGEHGNCGPKTENNDVKGRWNVVMKTNSLPVGSRIYGLGAGCATSFIYAQVHQ